MNATGEHTHAAVAAVVAAAVLFQLIAAIFALRLIPLTGRKTAWLLIAVAIALMTERRFESLVNLLFKDPHGEPNVLF
jgi:hypothetical protein